MTPVQRKDHLDTFAITLLVVCCAFWGFQQILIKFAGREIPPLWQASVRMAGATALLWLWCQVRGVKLFTRDGSLLGGLLVGLLFAAEFCLIYLGLQHTSASRLTVFLYTSPFWVALLLPRFVPTEKMRGIQWVGLFIAFAAVGVAFSEAFLHGSAPGQWKGDAMGLAAGMFWGLTTIAIRTTKVATIQAEKSLFYQLSVTATVCPLLSLALGETWSFDYSALAWGSVFLQTAVGRVRQLPGLDVDAAPLPRDADVHLHLPHPAVRAGVRRGAAERTADHAAGAGAGGGGVRDCAGEPEGLSTPTTTVVTGCGNAATKRPAQRPPTPYNKSSPATGSRNIQT